MTPLPFLRTRRAAPPVAWRSLAIALSGLAGCGAALAQASPYYIGVSQALTIESNLGRLADGEALPAILKKRGDTISTTALVAGFDQPISRQRVRGSVRLNTNRYVDNPDLNNQGYSASLGLDWETVNRLSGTAEASSQRSLRKFDPNETNQGLTLQKNLETVDQLSLSARIGGTTRLTGQLGLNWRQVDYSAPAYTTAEYTQTTWSAGLNYRASGALVVGTALRTGTLAYNRPGDDRRRHDIDLNATWQPSGDLTRVYGRISYTTLNADLPGINDFRGFSGEARVNWRVTGKTTLTGRLVHDTGQDSSFVNSSGGATPVSVDYSRTTTTLFVGADHTLTGKVNLNGGLTLAHRNLSNSLYNLLPNSGPSEGTDLTTGLNLGGRWQANRALQLGCDLSHERRTSSGGVRGSTPYTSNSLSCFGQLILERL